LLAVAFDQRHRGRGVRAVAVHPGGIHTELGRHMDLDAIDLLRALIGVANVATSLDWQQSARRLVDILIAGSRPAK
jgi:NAD(P)-dependent dehydrogenase (short-subunit alcohol dehydrogenase family)